ncbi:MAG TPA: TonB-dependent receptor plug domain-containing protein, partial [Phnomibacter sp.]|nr:TonB-dependent receptor plug domain-containing protein [Phnomibacter sp.]
MRSVLFILTLFISLTSFGDPGPVRIVIEVRDIVSGEPIPGATLHIQGRHYVANEKGAIAIETSGKLDAQITAIGYKTGHAHIEANQTFAVVNLLPGAGLLNDVVVSASLRPMQRMASVIPVESYQSRYFKRNPTPSVFDAIGMINGVRNQVTCNVCNTGEIRINGLDGPYTMVLIDGMPIVSSLSTVYGLSGIPNSMVKRIEVVKGPASTLYGSEAVAGLINIITVDP